jgi:hypothetical protein
MLSEILIAAMLSQGMGEAKAAPYVETRIQAKALRFSAQGELSRKVESGQGYRLGADAEWFGPLILSASYRYRDGGAWVKQGAWLGAGVGTRRNHLTLRQELGHERTVALGSVLTFGRIEVQGTAYTYSQERSRSIGFTLLAGVLL